VGTTHEILSNTKIDTSFEGIGNILSIDQVHSSQIKAMQAFREGMSSHLVYNESPIEPYSDSVVASLGHVCVLDVSPKIGTLATGDTPMFYQIN
jgi:hypothetical protein